ncbi:MAG: BolA family transcriptional regulator, partial [Oxalobacteraceae bacterium]
MTNLTDKSDREPRMRAQLESELAPTLLEISDDS